MATRMHHHRSAVPGPRVDSVGSMIGAGIGVGVAIGVALWLITDNAVWIGAGIAIGVAIGAGIDQQNKDDDDTDDE